MPSEINVLYRTSNHFYKFSLVWLLKITGSFNQSYHHSKNKQTKNTKSPSISNKFGLKEND